jgi:large repetitive protein
VDATFAGSADYTAGHAATTFKISSAMPTVMVHDKGGTFNGQSYPATATLSWAGKVYGNLEGVSLTLTYYAGSTASGTVLAGARTAAGT